MTTLDKSTFDYLQPSPEQVEDMKVLRIAAQAYMDAIEQMVPDGPDKTVVQRKVREAAMWANVAVTRLADGSKRP